MPVIYRTAVKSVNKISVCVPWQHPKMDDEKNRLREARISAGFESARKAALRHNWVPSTYASHENGQTPVPRDAARKYAKAFKVTEAFLLGVDEPINQPSPKSSSRAEISFGPEDDIEFDSPTVVPEIDIRAGASYVSGFIQEENGADGSGHRLPRDVVRANWGVPAPFLRSELHIRPGNAHILPVRGDSMVDALFDGDRAIVNLDDRDIGQGGIFALLDDNAALIIKQVEVVRGSKGARIRCTSRNPAYSPFELELADPVRIIGRVAGKITRL